MPSFSRMRTLPDTSNIGTCSFTIGGEGAVPSTSPKKSILRFFNIIFKK